MAKSETQARSIREIVCSDTGKLTEALTNNFWLSTQAKQGMLGFLVDIVRRRFET